MKTDLRYETKYSIVQLNHTELENIICTHPAMFKEIYSRRSINNIYFDDYDFNSFIDNIEGERDRKKVRIRWYGDLFGVCKNPSLEVKYKSGLLGWKERHKLSDFNLDRDKFFNFKEILDPLITQNNFEIMKLNLTFLRPTLLNCYERTYFMSRDEKFRVTLDRKMEFYSINPIRDHFKIFSDEEKMVIELKYDEKFRNEVQKITQYFPFRVTKNSKYVIGVERLKKWN